MPEVPWREASAKKMHKWKYSQVYKGFAGARPVPDWTWEVAGSNTACTPESNLTTPGCVPVFRTTKALGLICGDAFAPASKFDGCVFSAHCARESIAAFFRERLSTQ